MPRRIFLSLALAAAPLLAQSTDPIVHTASDLQQREAKLIETAKANPTGLAIGRLEDYGNDYTLLVVRVHTGDAERHQFFADQIVITKGTITLITGGTMQNEHPNNTAGRPGETLGSGYRRRKRSHPQRRRHRPHPRRHSPLGQARPKHHRHLPDL